MRGEIAVFEEHLFTELMEGLVVDRVLRHAAAGERASRTADLAAE